MIEIGRFEPRDIGRDLEQMLEHRENAADDRRGHDAVADRERALDPEHFPIDRIWRKEINRTDDPESERQEPDRDPHAKTGANQTAPFAHLQREINRGESADQSADQQGRIDFAEKNAAPQAHENRGVKAVIAVKKHAEQKRRERIGRDQADRFRPEKTERAAVAENEKKLRRRELEENDAENEKQPRAAQEGRWLVNPKLRQRRGEEEQRDDEILRRLGLLPAENQSGDAGDEGRENKILRAGRILETVEQLVLRSAATRLTRSEAAPDELTAFQEIEHVTYASRAPG